MSQCLFSFPVYRDEETLIYCCECIQTLGECVGAQDAVLQSLQQSPVLQRWIDLAVAQGQLVDEVVAVRAALRI